MTQAIFLSYASQDADAARGICEALRAAGLEVWFDQSELRGGDAWDASIRKQIKECALFVPIISANTDSRPEGYFRLEWKLAVDRSHLMADDQPFFMPVILGEAAETTARVPEKFRERQWTRLSDDASITAFAERIAKVQAGSALTGESASNSAQSGDFGVSRNTPKVVAPAKAGAQVSSASHGQANLGPDLHRDDKLKSGDASMSFDKLRTNGDFSSAVAIETTPSIAVLAFANRSASADDEYFSDGLADELLNMLATIKGLRVSARASSFQFKGKTATPMEIGRTLNVRHLLDGSVRKSGNRARIAVQLVDTLSGDQQWSETFDRTLDDVFAVQDEIAQAVSQALRVKLITPVPGSNTASLGRTTNPDAHRERMQGKALFQRGGYRDRAAAVAYFERAVALDPQYAGAWADLSFALYWRSASGGGAGDVDTTHDYMPDFLAAREAALRASSLEPNLPEALTTQAALARILDWNQTDALQLMRRAALLAPNDAVILMSATKVCADNGYLDEAASYARRAMEVDPMSLRTYAAVASIEAEMGRFDEAEKLYRQAVALSTSDSFDPRFSLFVLRLRQGRLVECEAMLAEWSVPTHRTFADAMLAWAQGDLARSEEQLDVAKREAAVLACYQIAMVHAYRKQADETLTWLTKCIEVRDPGVFNAKTEGLFRFLHDDPRFVALLKRIGFTE